MTLSFAPTAVCPEPYDPHSAIERVIGSLRAGLVVGQEGQVVRELVSLGLDPGLLHMCLIAAKILVCDLRRIR